MPSTTAEHTWVVRRAQICQSARSERDLSRLFVCSTPLIGASPHICPSPPATALLCCNLLLWRSHTSAWLVLLLTRNTPLLLQMASSMCFLPSEVGDPDAANAQSADPTISASCSPRLSSAANSAVLSFFWDIWERYQTSFQEQMRIASPPDAQQIKDA